MAIRLRKVNGHIIALSAAKSVAKIGDVYIDDAQHEALANKFARDTGTTGCWDDSKLVEVEESNNPNRTWWDKTYK